MPATLTYDGDDVIITGSVGDIFQSQSFIGPNRGEKQDRARIDVGDALLALVDEFAPARTELAEARQLPLKQSAERLETQLADAGLLPGTPAATTATIDVASLDAPAQSSALDAISSLVPDQSVPMPAMSSTQLAYARETGDVTQFATYDTVKYSEKEMWCLATAIYFEARGESYQGQVAVAQVVMNRTQHKLYPNTICGVVFQNQNKRNACQFSFACDGIADVANDRKAWAQAEEISTKVVSGELYLSDVANATHYHATYVYPHWAPRMTKLTKIGLHVFYRFKKNWSYG